MQYEPLDTTRGEIRLLKPLNIAQSDLIHFTLSNIPLTEAPKYFAISYTWGDPIDRREIVVNEQVFTVTATCWEVLNVHCSILKLDHLLWVDAICINQSDLTEREQQVLRMRHIYERGICTIHLGHNPRDPFTSKDDTIARNALLLLSKSTQRINIAKNFEGVGNSEMIDEKSTSVGAERDDPAEHRTLTSHEEVFIKESLPHIFRFLDKPWFSRMWIIQEFATSPVFRPAMVANNCHVPSEDLFWACSEMSRWSQDLPTIQRIALLSGARRYLSLGEATIFWQSKRSERCMLRFLWRFRDQHASDPRDKVYALLGMFDTNEKEFPIQDSTIGPLAQEFDRELLPIDYKAPIELVYARTTQAIVVATNQLDVICACQGPTSFTRTWTPDWSQPWSRVSLLLDNMSILDYGISHAFHATGSRPAEARFSDDLLVLYTRGIHHSNVVRTSIKWSSRDICNTIDFETEYENLIGDENMENGHTEEEEEERKTSLFLAMIAGRCFGEEKAGYQDVFSFVPGKSQAWYATAWKSDVYTARFIEVSEGRRTILTDSGHFGLGPEHLEGDIVCILLGCNVPVVLRKIDNYYILVGECYIHGIMQGEAIDKEEASIETFEIH